MTFMRTLLPLVLLTATLWCHAQDGNPYASLGYEGKVHTLVNKLPVSHVLTFEDSTGVKKLNFLFREGKVEVLDGQDSVIKELPLNVYVQTRWLSTDPVVHHDQSPYNGLSNNPILYVDPDGQDVDVAIRATRESSPGHAAVFVTAYKKVKILHKGETVERWKKTGYKVYDLTPAWFSSGYSISDNIEGSPTFEDYDGVFKVNDIDESTADIIGADGTEYYTKQQVQTDLDVQNRLTEIANSGNDYHAKKNNCVDYCVQGTQVLNDDFQKIGKEPLKHPISGNVFNVSTPNQLAKDLKGIDHVKTVKTSNKFDFDTQEYIDNPTNVFDAIPGGN